MKVILLAGGLGTRISEETDTKPKPMVLLDDKPIIWHLMSIYAAQGFDDFLIATGYKGFVIEEWVSNLKTDWQVKTLDTGLDTQTGGRIKKCMDTLPGERIMVTYGDGLGNININELLNFHLKLGKLSTVTAVRPPARFGVLESSNGVVTHFGEKKQSDVGWINGGFFILEPKVSEFVENDLEPFESHVMPRLVEKNNLAAYHHEGFWQPMDTLREKNELSELVKLENPPWLKI
jgi:glucose-1-phosphate cytidylyltransferase